MKWESKKWGTVAQCIAAAVAVLSFLLTLLKTYPMILWFVVATLVSIVLSVILLIKWKKWGQRLKDVMTYVIRVLVTSVVAGIVSLLVERLYTGHLSVAIGEVIKREGTEIAECTEKCLLEEIREVDERVVLAFVDSEAIRKRAYRNALTQARENRYIDFIEGHYQARKNWIVLQCTLVEDENTNRGTLFVDIIEEDSFAFVGEKVPLLLADVLQHLPRVERNDLLKERKQLLGEVGSKNSILLGENERKAIEELFKKHGEKNDLYGLIYSLLSDPNVMTELERKEAYDIGYYELREYKEGAALAKGERIVELLDSPVIIKKTVVHLSPYDKVGIIGCYLDELMVQDSKSKEQPSRSTP